MKDSLKLMEIYRKYLEISEGLIDILERHCKNVDHNQLSITANNKYAEFQKHVHTFIEHFNIDLHTLFRINYELKEIENLEKKKKQT